MNKPSSSLVLASLVALSLLALQASAWAAPPSPASPTTNDLVFQAGQVVSLPAPDTKGGKPLMAALAARLSTREYRPDPLTLQTLSDLLWAANGINRPAEGKTTAATARNWQNQQIFVATARGLFHFDPKRHALVPVSPKDLRAQTGRQPFVAVVPVNLIYVADPPPTADNIADPVRQATYEGIHAGIVSQNVALFVASAGLATVVRANFDASLLEPLLGLLPGQRVVLTQSVGYAK
jgi:nitroreductase